MIESVSLAQRLGLVEQPKSLMNETEWALAKSKAQQRDDFLQPCVICKEDIGKICHVSKAIRKICNLFWVVAAVVKVSSWELCTLSFPEIIGLFSQCGVGDTWKNYLKLAI